MNLGAHGSPDILRRWLCCRTVTNRATEDDMQPPPLLVIGLGCVMFIYQVSCRATHTSFNCPDRFGPNPPTHMNSHTIWHHVVLVLIPGKDLVELHKV